MGFRFPFFDITRQYAPLHQEVMGRFQDLLLKQALILGDAANKFETDVAKWIGVKHAVTMASGTDALVVALKCLGIGPGDEVITPAYSFFASTGAILYSGATPVFTDIDLETYNMDPNQIEAKITKRTKAIMPVHLYGQCADMDPIMSLARKHKLFVVEDYAQSIGAKYKDQSAGAIGDYGATSFYPTKNLGGAGDGGLVTTQNDELAEKARLFRIHGMKVRYHHEFLGTNSRLDSLQCAYLSVKLPHLSGWVEKRSAIASRYRRELGSLVSKGLVLPEVKSDRNHVWNQFIVRLPNRDRVRAQLTELEIPTEIYYPMTIPEQKPLRPYCEPKGWPRSEEAAASSLALPIFPELKEDEQGLVIDALKKVL